MNGADCVVRTLTAAGIEVCFANPGTSEMALVAALDRAPGMKCILGLFEGGVTGAADGYARMTGKPAVSLLHCGPGLANGLANLHNARRANVPLVNIVGDQATYHRAFLPPLASDAVSAARPFCDWVREATSVHTVGADIAAAIEAARQPPGQVATLIVPANVAWTEGASLRAVAPAPERRSVPPGAVQRTADILRSGEPVAILVAADAALAPGLEQAGRVAKAAGASLMGQMFNSRIARGPHLPALELVPYNVDLALERLSRYRHLILAGAPEPVGFFAYPGRPSSLVPPSCEITVLAGPEENATEALAAVAEELGAPAWTGRATAAETPRGTPADGPLTPEAVAAWVAALLPEAAVVVDESLTSGRGLFPETRDCPPHDWLQLTGGAIGIGIPLATGAAVGAPDRQVINLQADGSAMYTLQALWTQAREDLDVTTVIFANRAYAILRQELANMGVSEPGRNATDMMDLGRPNLDWVALANGMGVEAVRTDTSDTFADAFKESAKRKGPFLIEAVV